MSPAIRSLRALAAAIAAAALAWLPASSRGQCTPAFDPGPQLPAPVPPGANDQVYSSTVWDPDGAGYQQGKLVVGGLFTSIGGVAANRIAMFDGRTWMALGLGTGGGFNSLVYSVCVFNGELYAGGAFTQSNGSTINHVAKYNPATHTWSQVGSGFNGDVRALAVHENELFAGGFFTTSGATTVNHVARLSGGNWVALSGGGTNGAVYCLSSGAGIGGAQLYVGGQFTTAGAISARNVARWSSTRIWDPLGGGADGIVTCISGSAIGGVFSNVFYTDGTVIHSPGVAFFLCQSSTCGLWLGSVNYPGGQVYAITSDGLSTYAAGFGGGNLCYKYSGGTWTALGSPAVANTGGNTLTFYQGELLMGGLFPNLVGGPPLFNLGRFHTPPGAASGDWSAIVPRVNGGINCIIPSGTASALVGGTMEESASDGTPLAGILGYDPASNVYVSDGTVQGPVNALMFNGNSFQIPNLYAAGSFSQAGFATSVGNIATMSPIIGSGGVNASWSAVGAGFDGPVNSLGTFGAQGIGINRTPIIHAGGTFTNSGGVLCRNIAKFVSGAWAPLAGGVSSSSGTERVNCMTGYNGQLYVGGVFDSANNPAAVTVNSIAAWNGTAWSALVTGVHNGGVKGTVDCVISYGGALIVGGLFDHAGAVSTRNLAAWDGTNWTDMSLGIPSISDEVVRMAVHNQHLYMATNTAIGSSGGPECRVYKWTGSSWQQVGSGFGVGSISGMASIGTRLHVVGSFNGFPGADTPNWAEVECICRGDYDGDGQLTPADIADFVNVWFTSVQNGTLAGDFDGNGVVQPADIAAFVNTWFDALTNGC